MSELFAETKPNCPFGGVSPDNHENLREVAAHAIEMGIFEPLADSPQLPDDGRFRVYPTTLLDAAYGNGPMQIIRMERDIPVDAMKAVRKNYKLANQLLLPEKNVLHYFHNRFTSDDVFESIGIEQVVDDYKPYINGFYNVADESLSFITEGADRRVWDRALFTEAEKRAGVELTRDNPEIAMTVMSYQGVMCDYLAELEAELLQASGSSLSYDDRKKYEEYSLQWSGENFTEQLLPALAVFMHQAKLANPEASTSSLVTRELFSKAVGFIIQNGSFRHAVTVPASIATDGEKRVNHFSCPAVGTIRDQLADGTLLHTIYQLTTQHLESGDEAAHQIRDNIQQRVEAVFKKEQQRKIDAELRAAEEALPVVFIEAEGKELLTLQAESIAEALGKRKPAVFIHEGDGFVIDPQDIKDVLQLDKPKQMQDLEIDPFPGDYYYSVLRDSIYFALQGRRAVYFKFNSKDNRLDLDQADALLQLFNKH